MVTCSIKNCPLDMCRNNDRPCVEKHITMYRLEEWILFFFTYYGIFICVLIDDGVCDIYDDNTFEGKAIYKKSNRCKHR